MPSSTLLKFSLKIGSLPPDTFRVLEFTLDEAISACFSLQAQCSSEEENVAYDKMVGQTATLTVTGEDFEVKHHGVVTEFNEYPDASESHGHVSFIYDLLIEPRFKLLAYTTQSRIFQKQSAKEIIGLVLQGHKLADGTDFKFDVNALGDKREYTVQYNESDLAFVCRLLEEEGVFYYFNHEGEKDQIVMSDKVAGVKPVPHTPSVELVPEAGLSHLQTDHLTKLRRTQRMVTGKVTVKDYNFDTPQVNVIGRANKPGQGEEYVFGTGDGTASDAEKSATARSEALTAAKIRLDGEGICRAFRAGYRFKLAGGSEMPFAGDYALLRVRHHGDQREGFEGDKDKLIYSNLFACMPADVVFRPPQATPRPVIPGILTARVDGPQDTYAYLDDEGRYHAKLPFDLSDAKDGQASLPIRLSQPYAGANYGTHFPLHSGNDLVLAFIGGDVDRPVALGSIPNPSTASPVNKTNKSESIIRTASGHVIRLDDKEDKTVIDITTKGLHKLSMNDDKDHQEIRFTTTDKNEMVFDDKNKNIRMTTPEGAHLVKLDYDKKVLSAETKYGHKLTMDDEAKKIALQTKDGHILSLDDDKKTITLQDGKGKHVFQIDVGGDLISLTTEGDMSFSAKGSLNIEAKEISMTAKTGAINVKASAGDVSAEGMNVNLAAKQKLAMEGKVEAGLSGTQTKVEGKATLEISSKGQTKVGGLQVSVAGQAMSELKGAVVMIN